MAEVLVGIVLLLIGCVAGVLVGVSVGAIWAISELESAQALKDSWEDNLRLNHALKKFR